MQSVRLLYTVVYISCGLDAKYSHSFCCGVSKKLGFLNWSSKANNGEQRVMKQMSWSLQMSDHQQDVLTQMGSSHAKLLKQKKVLR